LMVKWSIISWMVVWNIRHVNHANFGWGICKNQTYTVCRFCYRYICSLTYESRQL
jgi:hypothetical protein